MKKVLAKKHTALIACSALMAAALTGGLAGLTNVTAHAEEGDVTYAPKIYYYVDAGNFVKDNGSGERFTGRDSCDGEGVPHSNETNFMKAYGLHYGTKDEAGKVTGLYNGYADNQLKEDDKTGKTWGVDSTNYGWAKWRVLTTSSTNTLYDGYQTGRHTEGGDLTNDHYVMTYKFEVDDNTTPLKITIGARAYGNGWGQTSYKYSINKPSDYDAEENGAYPLETSITAPESDDNTEHVSSELWPTQTITGVKEGDKYFVTLKIGEDATNRNAYLNWIMIATDNYELPVAYSFPNFVKSDATTITATPSDGTGDVTATITDESKAALAAAAPLSNVDIAVDVGDGKTATGTVTVLPASTKYFVNVGSDHDVEGTVRDVQYSASNGYGYVSAQGTVGWADAPYDESNRYDVTDMTYRFDLEEGSYSVLVGTFTWWNHVRTATITANNGPAVALKNSSSANGTKDSATCYGDVTSASGGHLDVKFVCPEKAFITYFLVYEHEHGTMTKTEAVASTCETKGTIEYYTCEICGQKYDDENATTLITDIEAALLPHSGTHHEA
ncbi:MAG: hypothetical protein K2L02_03550, partial [Clostridia bacterium]|nr:hypothetical protein [Clostridia bacterium]